VASRTLWCHRAHKNNNDDDDDDDDNYNNKQTKRGRKRKVLHEKANDEECAAQTVRTPCWF